MLTSTDASRPDASSTSRSTSPPDACPVAAVALADERGIPARLKGHTGTIILYHGHTTTIIRLYHGHTTTIVQLYHGHTMTIARLCHDPNTTIARLHDAEIQRSESKRPNAPFPDGAVWERKVGKGHVR